MIGPFDFGRRLKEIRMGRGLSQVALSKVLGHSGANQVRNYEEGLSDPHLKTLIKLCQTLDLDLHDFFKIMDDIFEPLDLDLSAHVHFGARLSAIRGHRGLTIEDLMRQCQVHKIHLSKYERGSVLPNLKNFIDLCNTLQVLPKDLLNVRAPG